MDGRWWFVLGLSGGVFATSGSLASALQCERSTDGRYEADFYRKRVDGVTVVNAAEGGGWPLLDFLVEPRPDGSYRIEGLGGGPITLGEYEP